MFRAFLDDPSIQSQLSQEAPAVLDAIQTAVDNGQDIPLGQVSESILELALKVKLLDIETLGQAFTTIRTHKGLTMDNVSDQSILAGESIRLSKSVIADIENDTRLTKYQFGRFCTALGIKPNLFLLLLGADSKLNKESRTMLEALIS